MEKKRIFRHDFVPLNNEYKFNCGEVATIIKEDLPDVLIKIEERSYQLPYREFIVLTKRID